MKAAKQFISNKDIAVYSVALVLERILLRDHESKIVLHGTQRENKTSNARDNG